MKKIIVIFIVLAVLIFSLFVLAENEAEKTAIKNATLDYLEGWYVRCCTDGKGASS